jgi:hypothetical protein
MDMVFLNVLECQPWKQKWRRLDNRFIGCNIEKINGRQEGIIESSDLLLQCEKKEGDMSSKKDKQTMHRTTMLAYWLHFVDKITTILGDY